MTVLIKYVCPLCKNDTGKELTHMSTTLAKEETNQIISNSLCKKCRELTKIKNSGAIIITSGNKQFKNQFSMIDEYYGQFSNSRFSTGVSVLIENQDVGHSIELRDLIISVKNFFSNFLENDK